MRYLLALFIAITTTAAWSEEPKLTGRAADLYREAQTTPWFKSIAKVNYDLLPTSNGDSFIVVWKPVKTPKHWLVSLHGSGGYATDDFAIWHQFLKGKDIGVMCVQWWHGTGNGTSDYDPPPTIYREIDIAARKLGIQPGTAMLHGFSRGSANVFAVAALDHGRGGSYFTLHVASSGGVQENYPPTRALLNGEYGPRPLNGTRWITAAGGRDENPDRDGIPAMRRTADWLKAQGATVVDAIEDRRFGHGALVLNARNARRCLDWLK